MADGGAPAARAYVSPWTFDLAKVTRKQYSDFRRGRLTDEEDDALLARVTGMSADMIAALPMPEFRQLVRDFYRKAMEPLADPNSASASSSP